MHSMCGTWSGTTEGQGSGERGAWGGDVRDPCLPACLPLGSPPSKVETLPPFLPNTIKAALVAVAALGFCANLKKAPAVAALPNNTESLLFLLPLYVSVCVREREIDLF